MKPKIRQQVFLDNMQFWYDERAGVLVPGSALSDERLSVLEVRERGMIVSMLEVVAVDDVPYVYVEDDDRLYRVGNSKVTMTGDEFYERELGATTKIAYLHGAAFRALMEKEMQYRDRRRGEDRAR